jgi:GntR family transcriptional regulator, transcriptional repressor for pyruvate dehydrogenase complex
MTNIPESKLKGMTLDTLDSLAQRAAPAHPGPLAVRVEAALRHGILTGQLPAGSRLPAEPALAAIFGVSRPVVRQAQASLKAQGLLKSRRGAGTHVAEISAIPSTQLPPPSGKDLGRILHGVELRLVIEPEAAALAALRRTTADLARMEATVAAFEQATAREEPTHLHDFGFHEAIALATANPRLVDAMRALEQDVSYAVRVWKHWGRAQIGMRMQDAVDEHREILTRIRVQDVEGARRAMRSHIEKARIRMMALQSGS